MAIDPDERMAQLGGSDPNQAMQNPGMLAGLMGGGLNDNTQLYMGETLRVGMRGREERTPLKMTYGEAKRLPLLWVEQDQNKLREFVNTGILRKIPGFKVGMGIPEIMSAWDDMLQNAWTMNSAGYGKNWTPWDVMNSYSNQGMNLGTVRKGDWEIDIATGERVKYVGPKSKTRTEKRVDLSSPEDARAITTQMLSELLGRAPTAEEMGKYTSALNSFEQANPQIATVTETLGEMGEVVSTETQTSGGVTQAARGQIISEEAKKGPEYGKFQSGTTYWNTLMQMVGG